MNSFCRRRNRLASLGDKDLLGEGERTFRQAIGSVLRSWRLANRESLSHLVGNSYEQYARVKELEKRVFKEKRGFSGD